MDRYSITALALESCVYPSSSFSDYLGRYDEKRFPPSHEILDLVINTVFDALMRHGLPKWWVRAKKYPTPVQLTEPLAGVM